MADGCAGCGPVDFVPGHEVDVVDSADGLEEGGAVDGKGGGLDGGEDGLDDLEFGLFVCRVIAVAEGVDDEVCEHPLGRVGESEGGVSAEPRVGDELLDAVEGSDHEAGRGGLAGELEGEKVELAQRSLPGLGERGGEPWDDGQEKGSDALGIEQSLLLVNGDQSLLAGSLDLVDPLCLFCQKGKRASEKHKLVFDLLQHTRSVYVCILSWRFRHRFRLRRRGWRVRG